MLSKEHLEEIQKATRKVMDILEDKRPAGGWKNQGREELISFRIEAVNNDEVVLVPTKYGKPIDRSGTPNRYLFSEGDYFVVEHDPEADNDLSINIETYRAPHRLPPEDADHPGNDYQVDIYVAPSEPKVKEWKGGKPIYPASDLQLTCDKDNTQYIFDQTIREVKAQLAERLIQKKTSTITIQIQTPDP